MDLENASALTIRLIGNMMLYMTEPGEGPPTRNPIIPKDGFVGFTAWSRFPPEIFPLATGLARHIIADQKYSEAYDLSKRVRRAEDLLKMARRQIVKSQNIPPKDEDPDIENRWSDESMEGYKNKLHRDNSERQGEVTVLHEELREKSGSSEFLQAYEAISSQVRQIVKISLDGFKTGGEEPDVLSQAVFNGHADELIDYNLKVLNAAGKKDQV